MSKLTLPMIRAAKPGAVLPDPRVAGLRYRCRANGRIFAELRYKAQDGKWRAEPLGRVDIEQIMFELSPEPDDLDRVTTGGPFNADTVLEGVRRQARELAARLGKGEDPRAAESVDTLGTIADEYLRHATSRPRTLVERRRHLTRDWAPHRGQPAASLTRADISKRLFEIKEQHGVIASNRSRSTLHAVMAWAAEHGRIIDAPRFPPKVLRSEPRRERVLGLDELRTVWHAAGDGDYAAIVRLLMLTGQRREEVGGMRWSELDLDAARWSLPPERTKNGKPHVVPLGRQAVAILRAVERKEDRDLLFGNGSGAFSGWSRCKRRLDGRASIAPWTLHDLRRSWATHVAKLTGRVDVVEMALNHRSGVLGGVAGTYIRETFLDERARAMRLWAVCLLRPMPPAMRAV